MTREAVLRCSRALLLMLGSPYRQYAKAFINA
jgi:hypothetical protein